MAPLALAVRQSVTGVSLAAHVTVLHAQKEMLVEPLSGMRQHWAPDALWLLHVETHT